MDEPVLHLQWERRNLSRMGFGVFTLQLATLVLTWGAAVLFSLLCPGKVADSWGRYALALLPSYVIAAPICAWIWRRCPVYAPEKRKVGEGKLLTWFVMGIPMMLLGNTLGTALSRLIGAVTGHTAENALQTLVTQMDPAPTVVFAAILAPIVEELLFRKLLIDRLRRYGERAAITVSGILFGLYHGNLYQFFYAAALGCLFGYVYCRTGKVRVTMAFHIAINTLGSVVPLGIAALSENFMAISQSGSYQEVLSFLRTLSGPEVRRVVLSALACLVYEVLYFGSAALGLVLLCSRWRERVYLPGAVTIPMGKRYSTYVLTVGGILCVGLHLALMVVSAMGL